MAVVLDTIRSAAQRVAASHHLEVVDVEFTGGAKHRTLRVFVEKDAPTRTRLAAEAAQDPAAALPSGVPVEMLSFVTHEDCTAFASDFGTLLDVEDLVPGAEYTLEVSSPGLERKLSTPAEWQRFTGSLAKVQLFTAVENCRHFTGRIAAFDGHTVTLDLAAVKQTGKAKKVVTQHELLLPLTNIERATLVAEV